MKKYIGISLLEVMLSLAIIAIILVMATRYFTITMHSEQGNEGVRTLQTVMKGSDDWFWTYKTYQSSTNNPDISITALANLGLVPKNFTEPNANPWGGTIEVTPTSATEVSITLTNLNLASCQNLVATMQNNGAKTAICATAAHSGVASFDMNYP
jgi:Tfp pilus assembly protein PilE